MRIRTEDIPLFGTGDELEAAADLAARLGCPLVQGTPPRDVPLALWQAPQGLTLMGDGLTMRADLSRMARRLRQPNLSRELLVRAARVKEPHPRALDATAGLGDDALLLAAAGFAVTLFERDPIIAALLSDGLARAATDPTLAAAVARMELKQEDSVVALQALAGAEDAPHVVLLDPMFPERGKSAQVKKKAQLLQRLEEPCDDEDELLAAALGAARRKVVVKRPLKGEMLAGAKPSYQLAGKAVRYDVFAVAR